MTATCGTHAHWKRGCWRYEDALARDAVFPRAVAGRNAGSAQVRWIHRSVAGTGITSVRCQARLDVRWKPRNPAGLHHHPAVAIAVDPRDEIDEVWDSLQQLLSGLPELDHEGELMEDTLYDAVLGAVESIPRARRKDLNMVQESVRRAVRAAANQVWGKKPIVTVFLTKV